jgi:ParB family chromosome partitioning protein
MRIRRSKLRNHVANKDLIRRALSVTSNLPSSVKGTDTSTTDSIPAPAPESLVSQAGKVSERPSSAGAPKTGPGSMLAFMTDQSEVHREVLHLREQAAHFDGADITRRLDPARIRPSQWANRNEAHFSTPAFEKLRNEIASAGGNVQPIKVRPIAPKAVDGMDYEIVFGHRRHRACLELGLPVLSTVHETMPDAVLFVEMERENRAREDLSAWEQGVMYMRALESGLFPSAKQMASAIDRDMGNISRAMALAKLPAEVVQAFGSPLNLQFRWATPLKDAHQKDPERLLSMARELASKRGKLTGAEVFGLLTAQPTASTERDTADAEWKSSKGECLAKLTTNRKGKLSLQFEQSMDATQRRKLIKALDAFFAPKA